MGCTYTKIFVYLKFKFYWESYILSRDPNGKSSWGNPKVEQEFAGTWGVILQPWETSSFMGSHFKNPVIVTMAQVFWGCWRLSLVDGTGSTQTTVYTIFLLLHAASSQNPESRIEQGSSRREHTQANAEYQGLLAWKQTAPPGPSHQRGRPSQAQKLPGKRRHSFQSELWVWARNSGRSLSTGAQQTLRPGYVSIRTPA